MEQREGGPGQFESAAKSLEELDLEALRRVQALAKRRAAEIQEWLNIIQLEIDGRDEPEP